MECINFFIDEAEEIDKKVNFSGQTFLHFNKWKERL